MKKGFTVLELLVILGIITILIALVLTSLNSARERSSDDRKVSNVKTVVVGLREYFSVCRHYPKNLTGTEDCSALASQQKNLKDIIPSVVDLGFNQPGSKYHYASLVDAQSALSDPASCTNFHVWVDLDVDGVSYASQKSNMSGPYTYAGNQLIDCQGTAAAGGLGLQTSFIFDIFK